MSDADLDFWRQIAEPEPAYYGGPQRGPSRKAYRKRRRVRRRRRVAPVLAVIFLVVVVLIGGGVGVTVLYGIVRPPDYTGQGTGQVTVQIREGDTAKAMGGRLVQAKVVKSKEAFVKAAKHDPKAAGIQPGFYQLRLHMSAQAAVALLLSPSSRAGTTISIPEGLRAEEIAQALAKKTGIPLRDFQRAIANPHGLGLPAYAHNKVEGYLFPARYDLDPKASARDILAMMVARFNKEAAGIDLETRAKELDLTPGQVIVVASLVQAEGGRRSDYRKIARVVYNRMNNRQPYLRKLQLDTTVLYAQGRRTLQVSNRDTQINSPYNTYRISGLPPGAIDNPGLVAIDDTLRPAKGNWVYFVTTDPSRKITKFTAKASEFNKFRQQLAHYLATHKGN